MIIQTVYRALLINNTYTKMKKKRRTKKKEREIQPLIMEKKRVRDLDED